MKERMILAAVVVTVILAASLLSASFQMIHVRAQMPGLDALFSHEEQAGGGTGTEAETGNGTGVPATPTAQVSPGSAAPTADAGSGQAQSGPGHQAGTSPGGSPANSTAGSEVVRLSQNGQQDTVLLLDVPPEAVAGTEFQARAALSENGTGKPVEGAPLNVSTGIFSTAAVTDDRGLATVNLSLSSAGNHTIVARYAGDKGLGGSTAIREVTVTEQPLPGWLWQALLVPVILGIFQFALMLVAAAALVAYDRLRRGGSGNLTKGQTRLPEPVDLPLETGYRIEFEDIGGKLPAVWGVDEPLHILVKGPADNRASLSLLVDGVPIDTLQLSEGKAASLLVVTKGEHTITVTDCADSRLLAETLVRIVDYREEIVRLFNDLLGSLAGKGWEIPREATPRELQQAVVPALPQDRAGSLDSLVSTFEIANYSLHTVGRDDYVRSYVASTELRI